MNFYDVVEDIKKLIGLDLQSIRPGANIRIIDVDDERSCVILRTSAGVTRSRPLSELQFLWNEMNRMSAVHVDEALHGSGTSRNQPETILANLPYVEWLKIDNKKHISFVGKSTHPFGTLKQMDAIAASSIRMSSSKKEEKLSRRIVIVTPDTANTTAFLQKNLSGKVSTVSQGVYVFENASFEGIIISSSVIQLQAGTYPILENSTIFGARTVTICDKEFYVVENANVRLLIPKVIT